jgi:hypothetical protein
MRHLPFGALSLILFACGLQDGGELFEAAPVDGGAGDTGSLPDASLPDASLPDASLPDAVAADSEVPDANAPDAAVADASAPDSGVDSGACGNPNACAKLNLPNIWSPVAYQAGSLMCPQGYNTPANPVTNPVAGSLTCVCAVTQNTLSCTTGTLATMDDPPGNGCGNVGKSFTFTNGQCVNAAGNIPSDVRLTPLPLSGTCTASATPDLTKVSGTLTTTCKATCPDDICAGSVPNGWGACIVAAGAQNCPAPFNVKQYTVGDSVSATCANTCACNQPACTSPVLTYFQNQNCTNLADTLSGSNCSPMAQKGNGYASVKYAATLGAVTAGSSTATAGLVNQATICCR